MQSPIFSSAALNALYRSPAPVALGQLNRQDMEAFANVLSHYPKENRDWQRFNERTERCIDALPAHLRAVSKSSGLKRSATLNSLSTASQQDVLDTSHICVRHSRMNVEVISSIRNSMLEILDGRLPRLFTTLVKANLSATAQAHIFAAERAGAALLSYKPCEACALAQLSSSDRALIVLATMTELRWQEYARTTGRYGTRKREHEVRDWVHIWVEASVDTGREAEAIREQSEQLLTEILQTRSHHDYPPPASPQSESMPVSRSTHHVHSPKTSGLSRKLSNRNPEYKVAAASTLSGRISRSRQEHQLPDDDWLDEENLPNCKEHSRQIVVEEKPKKAFVLQPAPPPKKKQSVRKAPAISLSQIHALCNDSDVSYQPAVSSVYSVRENEASFNPVASSMYSSRASKATFLPAASSVYSVRDNVLAFNSREPRMKYNGDLQSEFAFPADQASVLTEKSQYSQLSAVPAPLAPRPQVPSTTSTPARSQMRVQAQARAHAMTHARASAHTSIDSLALPDLVLDTNSTSSPSNLSTPRAPCRKASNASTASTAPTIPPRSTKRPVYRQGMFVGRVRDSTSTLAVDFMPSVSRSNADGEEAVRAKQVPAKEVAQHTSSNRDLPRRRGPKPKLCSIPSTSLISLSGYEDDRRQEPRHASAQPANERQHRRGHVSSQSHDSNEAATPDSPTLGAAPQFPTQPPASVPSIVRRLRQPDSRARHEGHRRAEASSESIPLVLAPSLEVLRRVLRSPFSSEGSSTVVGSSTPPDSR